MKKIFASLFFIVSVSVLAQDQFQKEAIGFLTFTKGKIDQLANAVPDDKYSWSPSDGVRPFASVIGHVISANYFLAMKLGATPPEGINPRTIEKDLTQKADLMEAATKSHEFVIAAIADLKSEELGDKVELPLPGDFTKMTVVNLLVSHSSEHLGQMIAYARMNGIAPPWSVDQ